MFTFNVVILSEAKDLKACDTFDVCVDREILHYVQNDVVERDVQNDVQSVFAFNAVILSEAKDLKVCETFGVSVNREILHYVQNDKENT